MQKTTVNIDSRADIHPSTQIADDVVIGPWTIIGPNVEIDSGTTIASHVVIKARAKIGKNNQIFQFASFDDPQDKKYAGEESLLVIGDDNVFREYVSINRGTEQGGGVTRIGDNNLFMMSSHVAHDCIVGNHTIFANNATIAGHVEVDDYVILGGLTGIHQFCKLGTSSFIAKGSMVSKDVLPYVMVSGQPAKAYGLNTTGLKRRGITAVTMQKLRRAYKIIFREGNTKQQALSVLEAMCSPDCLEILALIDAMYASKRGITR